VVGGKFMAIFRQRFVIESPFPVDEARKKLTAGWLLAELEQRFGYGLDDI